MKGHAATNSARDRLVGWCLSQCAAVIQQTQPGTWSFVLSNGERLPVTARLNEGWLILEAPMAGHRHDDVRVPAWTWLGVNAGLDGTSRIALLPKWEYPRLQADIPLDEDVDVPARAREACASFLRASHSMGNGCEPGRAVDQASPLPASGPSTSRPTFPLPDLAGLCRDAGWTFAERDKERLAVDLGVAGEPGQALMQCGPDGHVHVSVGLARCGDLTSSSRAALGLFLLTTCGLVRQARASVDEAGESAVARFEVRHGAPPCPVEIGHALSALSVAWALFGREAQALCDDRLARAYLAMRGRMSRRTGVGPAVEAIAADVTEVTGQKRSFVGNAF